MKAPTVRLCDPCELVMHADVPLKMLFLASFILALLCFSFSADHSVAVVICAAVGSREEADLTAHDHGDD